MAGTPAPLRLHWPLAQLREALPGVAVDVQARVGSTNSELLDLLRAGDTTARLLAAEDQTAGRGRAGRTWVSAPGDSLTFSMARLLAPDDWSGLSLAVGAALAEAIEPPAAAATPRLQLKWPNDLWLADGPDGPWRKLAGILIETVPCAGGRGCVVGVGLNVQPRAAADGLASGYACVRELDASVGAPALLLRVAPVLRDVLAGYERGGLAAYAAAFARRDLLRGRAVVAGALQGVADGIDGQGQLLLRRPDGTRQAVASGEVSVRPLVTEA